MSRRIGLLLVCATLVFAACGGGGSEPASSTAGSDTTTADGATTVVSETTMGEPAGETQSELATDVGLESIVVLTPQAGEGDRPELEWEPVEGASLYQVTVLAPDGSVYWGRTGPETSVPFGGFPRLVPAAAGPRIIAGMSWTVVAFDDSMVPMAIGGPLPLSP